MPKQKISATYNLKYLFPLVVEAWDYKKNDPIQPEHIAPYSKKKFWWVCKNCKNQWTTKVDNRTRGSGCPKCSLPIRKKTWLANKLKKTSFGKENSFAVSEWHPTKNGNKKPEDYLSGSAVQVWWLCKKCNNEWLAQIKHRSSGSKCPPCANVIAGEKLRLTLLTDENNFKVKFPHIAKEWHPKKNENKKPEDYAFSSNKKFWWRCEKGHEWEQSLNNRAGKGSNCPKCVNQSSGPELRVLSELEYFFAITHRYKLEKNEIDIFIPTLNIGIEYDGYYYHKSSISKDKKKDLFFKKKKIEIIRVREAPLQLDDFKGIQSDVRIISKKNINSLLDLLIPLVDKQIRNKIYKYQKRDSFVNEIIFNKYSSYFPKPFPEKSLKNINPQVSKLWHPKLNKPLKPENFTIGSYAKVWWKCKKGHEWQAVIKSIAKQKTKCFQCYKDKNTVIKTHPHLINEVHPKKNNGVDISFYSKGNKSLKVWWICKFGHTWKTTICSRTSMKSGCSKCAYNNKSRNTAGIFNRT